MKINENSFNKNEIAKASRYVTPKGLGRVRVRVRVRELDAAPGGGHHIRSDSVNEYLVLFSISTSFLTMKCIIPLAGI